MKSCENSVFAQISAQLQRKRELRSANSNTNAGNRFTCTYSSGVIITGVTANQAEKTVSCLKTAPEQQKEAKN